MHGLAIRTNEKVLAFMHRLRQVRRIVLNRTISLGYFISRPIICIDLALAAI